MEEAGKLKALRLPSGRRRFRERDLVAVLRQRGSSRERAAIYARVSSTRQVDSGNLERQIERLRQVADARGFDVAAVIAEQASGLNERRRGLRKLFRLAEAGEIDVVLVEFKDRLARFGFGYLTEVFRAHGVRVEVLEEPPGADETQELVQDMLAVVTVFAARLYGRRSRKFRLSVRRLVREFSNG